jgi:hypothetical protein
MLDISLRLSSRTLYGMIDDFSKSEDVSKGLVLFSIFFALFIIPEVLVIYMFIDNDDYDIWDNKTW